jgi:hypothetical protein
MPTQEVKEDPDGLPQLGKVFRVSVFLPNGKVKANEVVETRLFVNSLQPLQGLMNGPGGMPG